ncbi:ATP-binding protein [Candidatus Cyanaurora vandensis]|uniref:GAF domain-containing sensor histidine kinase n=1 Tax=Candidatus Cyanaurora vandensis TaxID=2714958 RepID=UPI00257D8544|nr:ATP-binding protein [Candidatus Cyanaurora vandensis]
MSLTPTNEEQRLVALRRYTILDTLPELSFDRITGLAARLFSVPICLISLVDQERAWFKSRYGWESSEVARGDALCNFSVLHNELLVVLNAPQDPRFACTRFVDAEPGIRFYAGAPLITHEGFNLGTLCILDTQPRPEFTLQEQQTLVDLAALVMDELDLRLANARLVQTDNALLQVMQGVATTTGEAFFQSLVQQLALTLGMQYAFIARLHSPDQVSTLAVFTPAGLTACFDYSLEHTPCYHVIHERKVYCHLDNIQAQFLGNQFLVDWQIESYAAAPLLDAQGLCLGLLVVMDTKPLANIALTELLLTVFATRAATELERKYAEDERERLLLSEQTAREQAQQANRLKDEFLAVVSHELRTPLNAMLGWTQLLQRGNLSPENNQRALETIERNGRAQNELIGDILDVSRIIAGKLTLNIAPVSLLSVVQSTLKSVQLTAEAKGVALVAVLGSQKCEVLGDANRLQQVVWNLLANAIKFTPNHGRVVVHLESQANQVVLTVSDTGIGIDPAFLPHIFERFRQADSTTTRRFGGLGLGLAIVRHLVELHDGTVCAQSAGVGSGATFTALLPLITAPDQPTQYKRWR